MPVELRRYITRNMLRNEREKLFVFGDNLARRGAGGQAREMRGEPNAVGLPTKRFPTRKDSAFFCDADYEELMSHIERDLVRLVVQIMQNKTVVWPASGIGTGLADLYTRAPKIANFYELFFKHLHKTARREHVG